MKKIIQTFTLIVICFNTIIAQIQPHRCRFAHTQEMLQYETQRALAKRLAAPATYDALTPYVFNLNFYQLNRADGTNMVNNLQLTVDNQIMDLVKALNTNYNQFNIFFKYRNFEIINDDYYSFIDDINAFNNFCNSKDPQNNSLKVLIYNPQVFGPNNAIPITYADCVKNRGLVIENWVYGNSSIEYIELRKNLLLHRMGDLLGLWHTESGDAQILHHQIIFMDFLRMLREFLPMQTSMLVLQAIFLKTLLQRLI